MNFSFFNTEWIKKAIKNNYAFVIWRTPKNKNIQLAVCKYTDVKKIYSYSKLDHHNGFVFAPFTLNKETPAYIIPYLNNKLLSHTTNNNFTLKQKENIRSTKKTEYTAQCESFIKAFKTNNLQKAVLAQCQTFTNYNIQQMPQLFFNMCEKYKTAFVYQLYIPDIGYWSGASPELLIHRNNETTKTIALAGTQKITNSNEIKWQKKEIDEQEFVTQYIKNTLAKFGVNQYTEISAKTEIAGKIAHLKTEIIFNSETLNNNIGDFINSLHPTPAICGLPKNEALKIILKTENFKRTYYSGFIGEINSNTDINLFVNLRCLQAYEKEICLYSGAGITKDSEPEKEWQETQDKMQTILEELRVKS